STSTCMLPGLATASPRRARITLGDDDGFAGVEVATEVAIGPTVGSLRVHHKVSHVVVIPRRGMARFVAPKAAALLAIPVVVPPRSNDERHKSSWVLRCGQTVAAMVQAISQSRVCHIRASHHRGLCT